MRHIGIPLIFTAALVVQAQQTTLMPPAPLPTATVSGTILCSDTKAPARLGQVILRSTTPSNAGVEMMKGLDALRALGGGKTAKLTKEQEAEQEQQTAELMRTATMMADAAHMVPIELDGTYHFTHVPPGTYQIHATLNGYIDPLAEFSPEDFASQDPAMQKRIAAAAPMVTINGSESPRVDLLLERGAAISGRVIFEDGSPAIGWQVLSANPLVKTADDGLTNPFGGPLKSFLHLPATTDDTGHFRLSGLPTGNYILQARANLIGLDRGGFGTISSGIGMGGNMTALLSQRLAVYSGSVLHFADAKPISVHAGDDQTGVEIVISVHTLHAVSGHVLAKTDAHAVNFGSVELTDKNDRSVQFTVAIRDDGSFRFDYIPGASSYMLTTHNVQDTITTETSPFGVGSTLEKKKTVQNYDQVKQDVQVMDSDVDAINVAVPALP